MITVHNVVYILATSCDFMRYDSFIQPIVRPCSPIVYLKPCTQGTAYLDPNQDSSLCKCNQSRLQSGTQYTCICHGLSPDLNPLQVVVRVITMYGLNPVAF